MNPNPEPKMEAKTLEQMARDWLAERYPDVTATDYTIKRHADFARYSHSALVAACEKLVASAFMHAEGLTAVSFQAFDEFKAALPDPTPEAGEAKEPRDA